MVRKMMLTAAVAVLAMPALASAQSTVTATATVAQYAEITGSGDLAFGTLSRTADNTISAAGGTGAATRTLDYNHNVTVSFDNVPTSLVDGTKTLAVSLTCATKVGAAAWSAEAACSGNSFDLNVGAALTTATLGFGGTITATNAANALAGSYSGTLDIVVVAR